MERMVNTSTTVIAAESMEVTRDDLPLSEVSVGIVGGYIHTENAARQYHWVGLTIINRVDLIS